MLDIVSAIYEMMGNSTEPLLDENTAKERVDEVFQVMYRSTFSTCRTLLNFHIYMRY